MDTIKGGAISVKDGVCKISYGLEVDGDQDGRAAGGIKAEAFIDIPELLSEALKDNATAQLIAKWLDANKSLLPEVDKSI